MSCRTRKLVHGLALFWLASASWAPNTVAQNDGGPLSREDLSGAIRNDALSVPTPGEALAALNKVAKLDWSSRYRPPISTSFSSRPQMALNLGTLITDGYIAVEAQDAQQVKNIGRDIVAIAKPLGVQEEIIDRGKSLTDFATENKWDVIKEELEATQNEAKSAMAQNKDPFLVVLVTVGAWVRGTDAVSGYLAGHYSPAGARLLRQPAVLRFLSERLEELPPKMRDESAVKKTRMALAEIEVLFSGSGETAPSQATVQKLNAVLSRLLSDLARKDLKS